MLKKYRKLQRKKNLELIIALIELAHNDLLVFVLLSTLAPPLLHIPTHTNSWSDRK